MPGLLRLLLLFAVGYLVIAGIRRLFLPADSSGQKQAGQEHAQGVDGVPLVQDPQCGRFIPQNEAIRVSRRGRTVYFCSQECRAAYRAR